MEKSGKVLKANNINMEGQFQLGLDASHRPARSQSSSSPAGAGAASAQAKVVETCPEYAVVEVTCGCGEKLLVKCSF